MDEKYFAKKIEAKWQKKWAESGAFEVEISDEKPKFYQLEMLPYPSGNLHMGHVRNYAVGDAVAWYKRLKGFNVLHPIGWDSFGQPAEDAAVKRGVNPRQWTEDNINVMRGQLERLGLSYDWRRQMYAHRKEYYKFDQWFFIKMFEMGLAYKKMTQVNWCENDKATLSNEQASGGICWRCGEPVTKKDLEQWFFRTTAYADQLIDDMEKIESGWPQHVLKRQQDWIGRSNGAYVDFGITLVDQNDTIDLDKALKTAEGEFDYDKLEDVARRIEEGRIAITRLNRAAEIGRIAGGRTHVEASIIVGAVSRAGGTSDGGEIVGGSARLDHLGWAEHKQRVKSHEDALIHYAIASDIWLESAAFEAKYGRSDIHGIEAYVHKDPDDDRYVIKRFGYDWAFQTTPQFFLDRIAVFNALFPEVPYELIGFTHDGKQNLQFVFRQKKLEGTIPAEEEIDDLFLKFYSASVIDVLPSGDKTYENDLYLISDIAPRNVLKDNAGNIRVFDAITLLNTNAHDYHKFALREARINKIKVFTTRIDTIYGANAVVVAAEHPIIAAERNSFADDVLAKIDDIIAENLKPKERDEEIEKDGIDTGLKAVNPFNGEELPVWVGNYVMMDYGTGAVMSVPAHDERDFEFAKKFGMPILTVISAEPENKPVENEEKEVQEKETYGINDEYGRSVRDVLADSTKENDPGGIRGLVRGDRRSSDSEYVVSGPAARTSASHNASEIAFTDHGFLINSGRWSGKTSDDAKREMAEYACENGFGEAATTFRLRDWGVSRQRYWGAPIPMIYCPDCGTVPVKFEDLPVELPDNAPITGTGESPLAKVPEFYETSCPSCEGPARRETDTMDTFVDSSWYFFRYTDNQNEVLPFDPDTAAYWTPVDQYIGGDDHAVMHLIYTRFWTKVMRDIGLVKFNEPVKRLLTQGMVVGETFYDDSTGKKIYHAPDTVTVERDEKGRITSVKAADGKELKFAVERMSKSKGNGVDPDEMVDVYGADAARLFVLFAAPVDNELVWHEAGIEGAVRFLQRVWRFVHKWKDALGNGAVSGDVSTPSPAAKKLRQKTHQTINRIDQSLDTLQFNTPVAALMELANDLYDMKAEPETASPDEVAAVREALTSLILMLTPFAPHISEEMFAAIIGNENGILANDARFPAYDEEAAKADEIEIAVQVNGKLRSRIFASPDADNAELERMAKDDAKVREHTDGKDVVKVIVVPGRLVNIVVKG
ncbi:MAG: class I tRNA ligase family protein [Acidobacteria bacterium]|nr:class I tRNA ligase family protein [Acidobacteriota bacterium]